MSRIGLLHTVFGAVALVVGLAVVLRPKGTRLHRVLGWTYTASMLGLLSTAFLIYRLFGGFGPFHGFAIVGVVTLVGGIGAAFFRRPRGAWIARHYYLMAYSYLGLLAATGAEIAVRVPGVGFKIAATVASVAVTAVGAVVIHRNARPTLVRVGASVGPRVRHAADAS